MKRIFTAAVLALCLAFTAKASGGDAGFHIGLEGGVTLKDFKSLKEFNVRALPGAHAGINFSIKLPMYFSIQPSVHYEWTRSDYEWTRPDLTPAEGRLNMHNIQIPVAVQWGPDLGILRPFVQVVPFADFNLGTNLKINDLGKWTKEDLKAMVNRVQFGLGLGGGLEVWRIQLSARYNWNFNDIFNPANKNLTIGEYIDGLNGKKRGVTVTLSYFFW